MKGNASSANAKNWWQWLLMYPSIAVAVISAMPTFVQLYGSYKLDVPFSTVGLAKQQHELWQNNLQCVTQHRFEAVTTRQNVEVGAILCPTGDVLLKVKAPDSPEIYRWVGLKTFAPERNTASTLLIRQAFAADKGGATMFAQSASAVVCQRLLPQGHLLRRVRDPNGQCFDEIINTYTGALIKRTPVPCNSNC